MDPMKKAAELRKFWHGFWPSRMLITANNLGVFEATKQKRDSSEIARKLKTDPRGTEILLDALAGLGLLKKSRGPYANTYVNTRDTSVFLCRGSAYYQGDILRHAENIWQSWSNLDRVVKTGQKAPSRQMDFDFEAFILGMHNIAVLKAGPVLKAVGLKGVKSALDLGGGPGTYAMEMMRGGVNNVTLFDAPQTVKIASRFIKKSGVGGVKFLKGDFLKDDIGRGYDMVFMSNILHSHSAEDCVLLAKKVKASLNPGGRAVIHGFNLEENRTTPVSSALFSINMLVNNAGRCYTYSEYKSFLKNAGLNRIKKTVLVDSIIVQGRFLG